MLESVLCLDPVSCWARHAVATSNVPSSLVIPGAHWSRLRWCCATRARGGLVLLSGYYHPTLRADLPLFSLPALPVFGDLIRHTAGPLLGAARLASCGAPELRRFGSA